MKRDWTSVYMGMLLTAWFLVVAGIMVYDRVNPVPPACVIVERG